MPETPLIVTLFADMSDWSFDHRNLKLRVGNGILGGYGQDADYYHGDDNRHHFGTDWRYEPYELSSSRGA